MSLKEDGFEMGKINRHHRCEYFNPTSEIILDKPSDHTNDDNTNSFVLTNSKLNIIKECSRVRFGLLVWATIVS